jgi:hypothetical protein
VEASLKRSGLPVIVACLAAIACKDDPARSVKIAASPPVAAGATGTSSDNSVKATPPPVRGGAGIGSPRTAVKIVRPSRIAVAGAQIDYCPPPAEDSRGPGNLTASGPCPFEHTQPVSCEASKDDFYAAFTRPAKQGATLVTYINVEDYHGPGSYDRTQVFVNVQSGTNILRWSNDNVHATVGPGEAFLTIPRTQLEAEPMLLDCSILLGPATNYQYQCATRNFEKIPIVSDAEFVSGTLQCGARRKD